MKEHPILFTGAMVRAILNGTKTQTRRVVKGCVEECGEYTLHGHELGKYPICPYGEVGDRIWVRETFGLGSQNGICHKADEQVFYRATDPEWDTEQTGFVWKPSIFMPRHASRIDLEITNVRVERVQDISEADAIAEGCCGVSSTLFGTPNFKYLWNSINDKRGYGWDTNPWVWVIEFKRIQT